MADKQVTKDELVDGMKYHVIMDDCCIKGEFTSVLRQVIYVDRDVDYLEAAYFENGLMLTSMDNCTIYEIE